MASDSNRDRPKSFNDILNKPPSMEEIATLIHELHNEPDHVLAIVGTVYLQQTLEVLVRQKMVTLSREEEDRLFNGARGGILSSFANLIIISRAFDIIEEGVSKDLRRINNIRNKFAHSAHRIDFETPPIREECEKLAAHRLTRHLSELMQSIGRDGTVTAKNIFFNSLLTIYGDFLVLINNIDMQGENDPFELLIKVYGSASPKPYQDPWKP